MNPDEFVYYHKTNENGETEIISGGFNVNNMFKTLNPLITINNQDISTTVGGKKRDVNNYTSPSEMYEDLVVPGWVYTYNTSQVEYEHIDPSSVDYISDDLHDKLIGLLHSTRSSDAVKTKRNKVQQKRKTRRKKSDN
jgi:hypothetical protein